ncbi:MAG: hypothetical protein ACK6D2_16070 [Planctomycetota bacterium]
MPAAPTTHPDRAAATLAQLPPPPPPGSAIAAPGAGAADCRIDLKLLQWQAMQAIARSAASRAHLAPYAADAHPDLWAGTVQDGVARGFAVRLEEAVALAAPVSPDRAPPPGAAAVVGKDLRRRKDLLVRSAGARVRFSRKEGVLFVARDDGLHASNCLRFEARADHGTLDGFVGAPDERARLFSAQFLQPVRYVDAGDVQQLTLAGRIGRGRVGWACEATLTGCSDEDGVRLELRIDNRLVGWRLRVRFLGLPPDAIAHDCTPVREVVANDAGGDLAFTLVRAVDRHAVAGEYVATPAAACRTELTHRFRLGVAATSAARLDSPRQPG